MSGKQKKSATNTVKVSFVVLIFVKFGLTYLFASLAINSGSLWQYGLAIFFFIAAIGDVVKVIVRLARRR